MGSKGAKASSVGAAVAERTVLALEPMGAVSARSMFGGHGIFHESTMFGIVDSQGRLYLRADDITAPLYEAAGSSKHERMPYWEVPDEVEGDPDELLRWAATAAEVAASGKR